VREDESDIVQSLLRRFFAAEHDKADLPGGCEEL
jgi:hypothetical protein